LVSLASRILALKATISKTLVPFSYNDPVSPRYNIQLVSPLQAADDLLRKEAKTVNGFFSPPCHLFDGLSASFLQ
jgi:hypothetical protein